MLLLTSLIAALILDYWLGEPRRFHPLVGFGKLATGVEAGLYGDESVTSGRRIWRGLIALAVCVTPFALLAMWLQWTLVDTAQWLLSSIVLYAAIGHASLRSHAQLVADALRSANIDDSRRAVAHLVSRNTEEMGEPEVSAATVESVLENGNDAIFGAIFWFVVAGVPGVVVYRLVNTLDAMWGYKNARYLFFGRASALLDDWLNWIPARLTAASYAVLGSTATAIDCWRTQGTVWKSPNAGPVMAAGAGALRVQLGGTARYGDELQHRPPLGCGAIPAAEDIDRSLQLVFRTLLLWVAIIALGATVLEITAA